MKRRDWIVEIRDDNLNVQGQVGEVELDAELLDNRPGSWSLRGVASPLLVEYLQNKGGILVSYKGIPRFGGPVNGRVNSWSSSGSNYFSATGQTDLKWVEERICHPSAFPFTSDEDVRTGPAESAAKAFVNFNMGGTAEAARQVFGLYVEPPIGIGLSGTWRGRMQPLGDLLREIALQGGDLTFDITQTSNGVISFFMRERKDLSDEVIFTQDLGNLASIDFSELAPTGNVIYVGDDGEGTDKAFVRRTDAASVSKWGRIEKFITQNSTVPSELNAKGDEELRRSAEKFSAQIVPVENGAVSYGVWDIGDIVGIEIGGVKYSQAIRQADLKLTTTSVSIKPVVGTPGTRSGDVLDAVMDSLGRMNARIKDIERG